MINRNKEQQKTIKLIKMAEVIDTWYFRWKDRITDNNYPHKLGFAKEELKQVLKDNIETDMI